MDLFNLQIVLDKLACLEMVLGLCLIGVGLTFMMVGFRIVQFVVTLSCGVIGYVIGECLPVSSLFQLICSIVFALLLAGFSLFLSKITVALLAGGWSGLAMILLADNFGLDERLTLLIGGFVFVAVLSLALVMYQEIVIYVTSLEGTLLLLSGLVIFISQNQAIWRHLRSIMLNVPIFTLFLVICGTVTAYYLQIAELSKKRSGASG